MRLLEGASDPAARGHEPGKSPTVGNEDPIRPGTFAETLEIGLKLAWPFCREVVDHPVCVAGHCDQPAPPQVGQVAGNLHLWLPQNLLKMANAERTVCEQMHNPQARRVAEAFVHLNEVHGIKYLHSRIYVKTNI